MKGVKIISITGPPGSGKGTQAKMISKKFKIKHISAGDILRKETKKKTSVGKRLEGYMDKGELAPNKIVNEIVLKTLKGKKSFILDGFPRDVPQAKEVLGKIKIDLVINLNVGKNVVVKRLLKRAKIEGRDDDTPKVIRHRFKVYNDETKPLLNYYIKMGYTIINIDGNGSPRKIFKDLCKILKEM